MIAVYINIGGQNVFKRSQQLCDIISACKHLLKQDEALHPAHFRDPFCSHLRNAADRQRLQHTLPVPSGGVEDHPSRQLEEHQARPWRAPLPRHGGHSWIGERGEGVPEPSVLLGEEAHPLCPRETKSAAGTSASQKSRIIT